MQIKASNKCLVLQKDSICDDHLVCGTTLTDIISQLFQKYVVEFCCFVNIVVGCHKGDTKLLEFIYMYFFASGINKRTHQLP